MQHLFVGNPVAIQSFRTSLSEARFARYLADSNGDEIAAISLYLRNCRLSQALYLPLQAWEITLRNKLNAFLTWKFRSDWPFNGSAARQLTSSENRRLSETIDRQRQLRAIHQVPTDAIVADLSAGFWVGLFARSYDIPFSWRYNLRTRIFPNAPASLDRPAARDICGDLLDLRNRVAHHEPIYHLPLVDWRDDLDFLLEGMCSTTNGYVRACCTFNQVWNSP